MDNLFSHKRASLRQRIKEARATLRFRQPYSQDFKLIEKAFDRLKAMQSRAGEPNSSSLWGLNGKLVDIFQQGGCANYFSLCGYEPN